MYPLNPMCPLTLNQPCKTAVLWDRQNVNFPKKQPVVQTIIQWLEQQQCQIIDAVVSDDWAKAPKNIQAAFNEFSIFFQLQATTDKPNRADNALINYGIKHICPNPEVERGILLSSDGDFLPLVKRLKLAGKEVWVIYQTTPNKKLIGAADRCIPFQEIIYPSLSLCSA